MTKSVGHDWLDVRITPKKKKKKKEEEIKVFLLESHQSHANIL